MNQPMSPRDGSLAVDRTLPSVGDDERPLLRAGDIVASKFRVEQVIGEGAMGVVYRAHHVLLDLPVALKVLSVAGADDEGTARFFAEARVAARIRSEHVCALVDVGMFEDGTPYIAMERLEGMDLADLVAAQGPLPIPFVIEVVLQVLDGLAHAHAAGVVHRDVKPTNVFVDMRRPDRPCAKLIDFGVCKSDYLRGVTRVGAFIGSPSYMAPEQIVDSRGVDARTDIWAIGVVLFELLTGVVPFEGATMDAVIGRILRQDPPSLRARRPDVPRRLETIVTRCLQRAPERRFADVAELGAALRDVLAFASLPPGSPAPPASRAEPESVTLQIPTVPLRTPVPPSVRPWERDATIRTSPPSATPRPQTVWSLGATAVLLLAAATVVGGAHHAWVRARASAASPGVEQPVAPPPPLVDRDRSDASVARDAAAVTPRE